MPSTSSLSSSRKTHRARKVTPSDEGIGKLLAARINKMPSKESVAEKSMDQEMDDNESVSSSQKGSPPVEQLLANRPKRSIVPKNMVSNHQGLSQEFKNACLKQQSKNFKSLSQLLKVQSF